MTRHAATGAVPPVTTAPDTTRPRTMRPPGSSTPPHLSIPPSHTSSMCTRWTCRCARPCTIGGHLRPERGAVLRLKIEAPPPRRQK
eukprot:scaffold35540_cov79-Isochrysis_galbana.AAC.1